VANLTW